MCAFVEQGVDFVTYMARRLPACVANSYIAPLIVEPCTHCLSTTRGHAAARRPTNVGKLNADAQKCFSCNQSNFYCNRWSRPRRTSIRPVGRAWSVGVFATISVALIDCRASAAQLFNIRQRRPAFGCLYRPLFVIEAPQPDTGDLCDASRRPTPTERHIRSVTQDETWYMTWWGG